MTSKLHGCSYGRNYSSICIKGLPFNRESNNYSDVTTIAQPKDSSEYSEIINRYWHPTLHTHLI